MAPETPTDGTAQIGTPPQSELERAQQRLARICMQMPMPPEAFGMSAYVNSSLQSARILALTDIVLGTETQNGTWTPEQFFEHLLIKHLNAASDRMEALKTQAPRVAAPGRPHLGIVKPN